MAVYAVTEVGTWTGRVLFYGKMELLGLRMLPCGSRNSWRKSVLEERERDSAEDGRHRVGMLCSLTNLQRSGHVENSPISHLPG